MNKIIVYHGSKNEVKNPEFGKGNPHNDYGPGFYTTLDKELAKEWSISSRENNGYVNEYELDLEGLKILDLSNEKYDVLNWIAVLLKYRNFELSTPLSIDSRDYIIKNYYIDVNAYDVVIGYRADDSYFAYAKDFVTNVIPVSILKEALELGNLGKQIVLISKKSFDRIEYKSSEIVPSSTYFEKRMNRDKNARNEYLNYQRHRTDVINDKYILDIIREGTKKND